MKIAIITDSTSNLSIHTPASENIFVVPLYVIQNGEAKMEEVEITEADILKGFASNLPMTTSQPSTYDFTSLYEKLMALGYTAAISLHCSSGISGTKENAELAAKQVGFTIFNVETKTGAYGLRQMVYYARDALLAGESLEKILFRLRYAAGKISIFVMPKNIEQLKKSGRVNSIQSLFTHILNIKIIATLDVEGYVQIADKIRTTQKAKAFMVQQLTAAVTKERITRVQILHTYAKEEALQWQEDLERRFPEIAFEIEPLVTVIATHLGIGSIGLTWHASDLFNPSTRL